VFDEFFHDEEFHFVFVTVVVFEWNFYEGDVVFYTEHAFSGVAFLLADEGLVVAVKVRDELEMLLTLVLESEF
jgi:hypothetical protein